MKLTKEIFDKELLEDYFKIIKNDELFFKIYDVETI
jgi:hypothetical protein